jgi:hypothetical protein
MSKKTLSRVLQGIVAAMSKKTLPRVLQALGLFWMYHHRQERKTFQSKSNQFCQLFFMSTGMFETTISLKAASLEFVGLVIRTSWVRYPSGTTTIVTLGKVTLLRLLRPLNVETIVPEHLI